MNYNPLRLKISRIILILGDILKYTINMNYNSLHFNIILMWDNIYILAK